MTVRLWAVVADDTIGDRLENAGATVSRFSDSTGRGELLSAVLMKVRAPAECILVIADSASALAAEMAQIPFAKMLVVTDGPVAPEGFERISPSISGEELVAAFTPSARPPQQPETTPTPPPRHHEEPPPAPIEQYEPDDFSAPAVQESQPVGVGPSSPSGTTPPIADEQFHDVMPMAPPPSTVTVEPDPAGEEPREPESAHGRFDQQTAEMIRMFADTSVTHDPLLDVPDPNDNGFPEAADEIEPTGSWEHHEAPTQADDHIHEHGPARQPVAPSPPSPVAQSPAEMLEQPPEPESYVPPEDEAPAFEMPMSPPSPSPTPLTPTNPAGTPAEDPIQALLGPTPTPPPAAPAPEEVVDHQPEPSPPPSPEPDPPPLEPVRVRPPEPVHAPPAEPSPPSPEPIHPPSPAAEPPAPPPQPAQMPSWPNQPAPLVGPEGKTVGVLAAKGGIGKTTMTMWVAEAMSAQHRVCVVDANMDNRDITYLAGVWGKSAGIAGLVGPDLPTDQQIDEALIPVEGLGHLLPGPQDPSLYDLSHVAATLCHVIRRLRTRFEWVFVDLPVSGSETTMLTDFALRSGAIDLYLAVFSTENSDNMAISTWFISQQKPVEQGGANLDLRRCIGVINRSDKTQISHEWVQDRIQGRLGIQVHGHVPDVEGLGSSRNEFRWQCPSSIRQYIADICHSAFGAEIGALPSAPQKSPGRGKFKLFNRTRKARTIK